MTDTTNNHTAASKTRSHIVYHVRDREGGEGFWTRIGAAWAHNDGKGSGHPDRNRFPVLLTRAAYDDYVTVRPGVTGQDEAGRLWDIVWMLRFAMRKARPGQARLPFALYVRNDNPRPRLVKLVAACGALDVDDPQPAITIMLPDEY